MESHITKLNNEQNKFSELRIEELEEENKVRDNSLGGTMFLCSELVFLIYF